LSDLGKHPLIHVCWDVGHAAITNVDQYKEITGLGNELRGLHIQDNFGTGDIHLAPFAGICCYDAIIKGLVDSAYKGYFTMETYGMPRPKHKRQGGYNLEGVLYDRLIQPPVELKQRFERLMYDTARFMLEQYGCFEE
jgi:sugar phosphate isomerase/epimerase